MARRKTRPKKQSGSRASSAAARLLAMVKRGVKFYVDGVGGSRNVTRSVKKVAASCLSQDETPRGRRA